MPNPYSDPFPEPDAAILAARDEVLDADSFFDGSSGQVGEFDVVLTKEGQRENRWHSQDGSDDEIQREREATMKGESAKPQQPAPWQVRLTPDVFDRPEAQVRFNFKGNAENHPNDLLEGHSVSEILLSHAVEEEDREPFYHLELLTMFRQRLRLVAFLGLLLVPLFHFFYISLSPFVAQQTRLTHVLMAGICALYLFLPAYISSLAWVRLTTVLGYALMCMGTSLIMVILAQNQFGETPMIGFQLAMLAAHSQILLSVVLLPLTLWECMVMCVIVTVSLAWSSWWTVPFNGGSVQTSQMFILVTTAVFVLCVAHFQAVLRRRAYDATFDLACSAAKMKQLSILDAVTGGANRLFLERNLTLEINRAARFAHSLSIMMFDLDNFKNVNDTQGHACGDEVLRVVCQAAQLAVRDVDTLARYGGDEFMVVLPETDAEGALAIAQRLQFSVHEQLKENFGADTPEGQVTLSMGLVTLRLSSPISTDSVIARVDERLYEAKRMGKNRIAM